MFCSVSTPTPHPQGKIYSQLGGVGGFCQDWTRRGGTGIETRGLQAKSLSFMLSEVKGKAEAQPVD